MARILLTNHKPKKKSKIDFYSQLETPNLIYVNTCIITKCTKEALSAINKFVK